MTTGRINQIAIGKLLRALELTRVKERTNARERTEFRVINRKLLYKKFPQALIAKGSLLKATHYRRPDSNRHTTDDFPTPAIVNFVRERDRQSHGE